MTESRFISRPNHKVGLTIHPTSDTNVVVYGPVPKTVLQQPLGSWYVTKNARIRQHLVQHALVHSEIILMRIGKDEIIACIFHGQWNKITLHFHYVETREVYIKQWKTKVGKWRLLLIQQLKLPVNTAKIVIGETLSTSTITVILWQRYPMTTA